MKLTVKPLDADVGVDGVLLAQGGRVRVGGQASHVGVGSLHRQDTNVMRDQGKRG
jgi:hypothetical protein